jgi:hypothetical protein
MPVSFCNLLRSATAAHTKVLGGLVEVHCYAQLMVGASKNGSLSLAMVLFWCCSRLHKELGACSCKSQ